MKSISQGAKQNKILSKYAKVYKEDKITSTAPDGVSIFSCRTVNSNKLVLQGRLHFVPESFQHKGRSTSSTFVEHPIHCHVHKRYTAEEHLIGFLIDTAKHDQVWITYNKKDDEHLS